MTIVNKRSLSCSSCVLQGFTPVPGDCLAFSLHRAACESTNVEERSLFVERGLSVAVSDSAKNRFSEFL